MSGLRGADTRRVDVIAEGLRGYSQDIGDLWTIAQCAVAEMRNAWGGQDFEHIAQRWDEEAGPRLADVSSALSTMATVLRAQAEEQRQASGNTAGSRVPLASGGRPGGLPGGHRAGGLSSWEGDIAPWDSDVDVALEGNFGPVEAMANATTSGNRTDASTSTLINGHQVATGESAVWGPNGEGVNEPTAGDHVKVNLAEGDVTLVDASLASLKGKSENHEYELSAGKLEAGAEHSLDVDARGNVVASAGASAAAYAGYAAGAIHRGSTFAHGTVEGKAYVGAEVKADASGSIGPDGARGHLGAEAFVGGKAEANLGGTVAGVTASAGAEISYGIGAHADVDAELSATKVGFSADIGATLGIGAGLKADVSVNPQEVIANVGHAADDVGEGLTFAGDRVASFLNW